MSPPEIKLWWLGLWTTNGHQFKKLRLIFKARKSYNIIHISSSDNGFAHWFKAPFCRLCISLKDELNIFCALSRLSPVSYTIYCEKPYCYLIGMILFKFISWQISKLPPSSISWFVELWTHTDTELMLKLFWYWRYRKHNNSDDGCHTFILFTI